MAASNPFSQAATNIKTFVTVNLDNTNYLVWESQVKDYLTFNDLYKFVDGTCLAPSSSSPKTTSDGTTSDAISAADWHKSNSFVKACLTATLSTDIVHQALGFTTARDLWVSLQDKYKIHTMPPNGEEASGSTSNLLSEWLNSSPNTQSPRCYIYKVHNHLREINKKAYEPEIIAIGPYHHRKESLLMMKEHKLRYMRSLLNQSEENLKKCINAIAELEKDIRDCYAEPLVGLEKTDLVDMMVLDGCFIIQLVYKYNNHHKVEEDDPIFQIDWMMSSLKRDLMLFENQVPFFVLLKLFSMTIESENGDTFVRYLLEFFLYLLPGRQGWNESAYSQNRKAKHLLDLIYIHWDPSTGVEKLNEAPESRRSEHTIIINRTFIRCATELGEAGVKFETKEGHSLFDVTFEKGTLQMPVFKVEDDTESFWRNLIVHEQYCKTNGSSYVTGYAKLLDCLMDSSGDVEILSKHDILDNWLGDGDAVSKMFNKITDNVILESEYYGMIFEQVNHHCNRKRNRWMAKLRHNYLDSPWGLISILAATILLLLTLTQTVFTVI